MFRFRCAMRLKGNSTPSFFLSFSLSLSLSLWWMWELSRVGSSSSQKSPVSSKLCCIFARAAVAVDATGFPFGYVERRLYCLGWSVCDGQSRDAPFISFARPIWQTQSVSRVSVGCVRWSRKFLPFVCIHTYTGTAAAAASAILWRRVFRAFA